ncbi:MAG: hypothetical protein PHT48_10125 [Dechloromonas sp.]|nr:hypothetical protein [Dechloromonas sp.]
MRPALTALILLTSLLTACATSNDQLANKHISQSGPLKVTPELLPTPPAAKP